MKHYAPDVPHITGLQSANCGFVPATIIGSVQGQDRREPNTCDIGLQDVNQNFIGDSCETGEDKDGDGFFGKGDNCENTYNANQQDIDDDGKIVEYAEGTETHTAGIGDLCDDDADGDGIPNKSDNCPLVANKGQETNYNHDTTRGRYVT